MFSRIFSTLSIIALLVACASETSPEPEGATIECAIGPGVDFSDVCTLEKVGSTEFLIHSPDGGFRRLQLSPESGEFGAVDGADGLQILSQDGELAEFAIGGDRYRIPHAAVRTAPE